MQSVKVWSTAASGDERKLLLLHQTLHLLLFQIAFVTEQVGLDFTMSQLKGLLFIYFFAGTQSRQPCTDGTLILCTVKKAQPAGRLKQSLASR